MKATLIGYSNMEKDGKKYSFVYIAYPQKNVNGLAVKREFWYKPIEGISVPCNVSLLYGYNNKENTYYLYDIKKEG